MNLHKNISITGMLVITVALFFTACNNNDDLVTSDVAGVYEGTLTTDVAGKSISSKSNNTATAVVTMVGNQIEVHCFNDNFDTTIMLNLYEDGDMINTCLTGTEFENMYGHMMGQSNMNGNMQNMGSQWMQHLDNEHQDTDEHFGGFNMKNHTFDYTFKMENGNFHFQGTK
ncbi:hypothetical protein EC396_08765 [Lutibacter sp. HS1-25]|uniref:hypothetical protein n=1 Tax=Lutibacter sp. HS1-25 TaxID=2485000 RepID=UPI001011AC22|nr:hypothetical protein [Lutibacter sp. HS1-25]RXP54796.1 hypothetical protein EC396_08765 [Lutibacter sp. HS1-25]